MRIPPGSPCARRGGPRPPFYGVWRPCGIAAGAWRGFPAGLYAGATDKEQAMAPQPKEKTASPPDAEAALGALPLWNLSDLYPGQDSVELTRDLERSER